MAGFLVAPLSASLHRVLFIPRGSKTRARSFPRLARNTGEEYIGWVQALSCCPPTENLLRVLLPPGFGCCKKTDPKSITFERTDSALEYLRWKSPLQRQ